MSKISNIEVYNRPREKVLVKGIKNLSNKELLALIIRCGIKGVSSLDMSEMILNKYGSLSNLLNADIYSLMEIKGIKNAKAIELMAVIELAKRVGYEKASKIITIRDADSVYSYLKVELENEIQEHFVVLFLNVKLKLIKKENLFLGGESSSLVDINFIFKKAIACGAKKIICIHNHPSGDPTPSQQDIQLTHRLYEAGELLGIKLLDHLIIGDDQFISLKEKGYL